MRNLILIAAAILLLVLLAFVLRNRLTLGTGKPPELTMDLRTMMPDVWQPYGGVQLCDFDADPAFDNERLVLYRYDSSAANPNGLIGAVVFTEEVDRVPQAPGNQSAYRPAFLIPYKLLPDIYANKGQGYLGESGVQVRFWLTSEPGQNKPCRAREINIFGLNGVNYTRLSVFRWDEPTRSYAGWHFAGTARLTPNPVAVGASQVITQVTTYDRFNDRSMLCQVHQYARSGPQPASVVFTETQTAATIDFCYGAPDDPFYPEAVVLATLRGKDPQPSEKDNPTGASFFRPGTKPPPELNFLTSAGHKPMRVLVDRHRGLLNPVQGTPYPAPYPAQGTETRVPNSDMWWWSAEQAFVDTTIDVPNVGLRDYCWTLRSVANTRVAADVHWRIEGVASGFCAGP